MRLACQPATSQPLLNIQEITQFKPLPEIPSTYFLRFINHLVSDIPMNPFDSCSVTKLCPTYCYPLCPSLSPGVGSNSCLFSGWCHPTITFCHPFLLLPSNFPSIRVFSNESTLCNKWSKYWSFTISPSNNIQGWFPSGLTGLISLLFKRLSRVFSSTTIRKSQFFDS